MFALPACGNRQARPCCIGSGSALAMYGRLTYIADLGRDRSPISADAERAAAQYAAALQCLSGDDHRHHCGKTASVICCQCDWSCAELVEQTAQGAENSQRLMPGLRLLLRNRSSVVRTSGRTHPVVSNRGISPPAMAHRHSPWLACGTSGKTQKPATRSNRVL